MDVAASITRATASAGARGHKLSNRFEQDLSVPFPLQAFHGIEGTDVVSEPKDGQGHPASSGWLSDEAYQTYSVRGGTDKWRDNLRRRVEMHKFESLHGESDLVKAITQPRGRSGTSFPGKVSGAEGSPRPGGWKGSGKRRRGWERGGHALYGGSQGDGGRGDEDFGGGGEAAVGRLIKLDPVAKLRNSSLTLQEHRTFQAVSHKLLRFEHQLDPDARPLTAEERQALDRLDPLVRAEQAKYADQLSRWRESGRAPYRFLEKSLASGMDACLQVLRNRQQASLPRHYQLHFTSALGRDEDPGAAPPEPKHLSTVKPARAWRQRMRFPSLPMLVQEADSALEKNSEAPAAPPSTPDSAWGMAVARRWMRMGQWGERDAVFAEADMLVDLPALLALTDPGAAWVVPFSVRWLGGEGGAEGGTEGGGKKVLVVHSPLLPPTMTWRERAEGYFQHALVQQLRAPGEGKEGEAAEGMMGMEGEEETLSLEVWQLAQLKVVVASERAVVVREGREMEEEGRGEGGTEGGTEALLAVEVDYALEWSEEEEPYPQGLIRHVLYDWVAGEALPLVGRVDGKGRRLMELESRRDMGRWRQWEQEGRTAWARGEVTKRLVQILGLWQRQATGSFVARHDPVGKEMRVYRQVPEKDGGGGGEEGPSSWDLHAYIAESGRVEEKAAGSWRMWRWPDPKQHIPGTFVPR